VSVRDERFKWVSVGVLNGHTDAMYAVVRSALHA
jgi:hypothetical protein